MDPHLLDLLSRTETDRIEWKESVKDGDGILRAVCALANDLGRTDQDGYVVVGLAKNGSVVGIDERGNQVDEETKRLSDRLRSTRLLPSPSTSVSVVARDGKTLLLITVSTYPVPPVVGLDGSPWVRVGTTTRRATDADLARLAERRPSRNQPFDTREVPGTSITDLDLARLRPAYEAARESDGDPLTFPVLERWLETRREAGGSRAGVFVPNAAAILVHGCSPQSVFPGATIEFARYGGDEIDAPVVLRKTITGTLPDQIDALDAQLRNQVVSTELPAVGARQSYAPEYPIRAFVELTRNLVQHRTYESTHAPSRVEWYSDRVEFSNPGGPFQRASEGEFGSHADYRNPLITKMLVETGHVQQLGRGIRIARSELEKNGNPPLEVETDGFTRVIVRRRA